jgi:hypothetical protein
VRRLLSSPRRRRRLVWTVALAGVFGAVVLSMVIFTGPGPIDDNPSARGPGWLPPDEPQPVKPTHARVAEGLQVARQFIATAVARRHVEQSWSLVTPSLRDGYTRAEWARGEIPIVPYPVDSARWQLDYTYSDSMGFKVALFPTRGADVRPTVFNLDLKAVRSGDGRRWLVEGFTPGIVRAPAGSSGNDRLVPNLGESAGRSAGDARLGAGWLAVPFAVLGLAVLVPIGFGVANWRRNRAAAREWARDHPPTRLS